MKGKLSNIIIFILSSISLIISLKLFWNLGVYVDEKGTSPDGVLGGDFWLYMNWIKLVCLFVISILSFINIFCTKNK